MSDIYSVQPLPGRPGEKEATVTWVNANTVLQRVLQQLDADERKTIVLRCDELPLLLGTERELEAVFSGLLQMILEKKTSVHQLFLHIYCRPGEQGPKTTFSKKQFIIQFNTNIDPCPDWMQLHDGQLAGLIAMVQKQNGSLEVAEAQGCIFSLSLPGKPL